MEMKKLIDSENWTFSGFKSSNLLAFIHLGAEPSEDLEGEEEAAVRMLYLVTVMKDLEEEMFQMEYESLAEAIDSINSRYQHWDFVDRTTRLDDGGCGSCEAH